MPDMFAKKKVLGREIRLTSKIGAGAFGQVHRAELMQQPGSKPNAFSKFPASFVVKIIKSSPGCETGEMVYRELETCEKLNHPYITGYLGKWVEGMKGPYHGCYCLAMHYCNGGDLHDRINRYIQEKKRPSKDIIVRVLVCVFTALNYSHAQHVIHRDIKPANVFLKVDETSGDIVEAVVGDYGLARPLDTTMEMAMTRVGTPSYCSPEVASGEPYTNKTDIFSAGATLFELMTLERPFHKPGHSDAHVLYHILNYDPIPRLRTLCPGRTWASLVAIVSACLEKNERHRPSAYAVLTQFSATIRNAVRASPVSLYPGSTARNAVVTVPVPDSAPAQPRTREKGVPDSAPAQPRTQKKVVTASAADDEALVKRIIDCMHTHCPKSFDRHLAEFTNHVDEDFLLVKVISHIHRHHPKRLGVALQNALRYSVRRPVDAATINLIVELVTSWESH